jgi:hypothetical protein
VVEGGTCPGLAFWSSGSADILYAGASRDREVGRFGRCGIVLQRDRFISHGLSIAWRPKHRAYFNGYAMWTYLNTPFLLKCDGVQVEEEEAWHEGDEIWRFSARTCRDG